MSAAVELKEVELGALQTKGSVLSTDLEDQIGKRASVESGAAQLLELNSSMMEQLRFEQDEYEEATKENMVY